MQREVDRNTSLQTFQDLKIDTPFTKIDNVFRIHITRQKVSSPYKKTPYKMTYPKPKGIPNKAGNGCWFASMSQTIFRQDSLRDEILNFEAKGIKVNRQSDYEKAFGLLKKYFEDILGPEDDFSNVELLRSLPYQKDWLFREDGAAGKEANTALYSFSQTFNALCGCEDAGFHSFGSPLSDIYFMRFEGEKRHIVNELNINDRDTLYDALMENIKDFVYLPKLLFLEANTKHTPYLKPTLEMDVPEPLEYVACNCDVNQCKSKVHYSLVAMIIYLGKDAGHATALVKDNKTGVWYYYNDSYVTKEKFGSKDMTFLEESRWPKVFLYKKM